MGVCWAFLGGWVYTHCRADLAFLPGSPEFPWFPGGSSILSQGSIHFLPNQPLTSLPLVFDPVSARLEIAPVAFIPNPWLKKPISSLFPELTAGPVVRLKLGWRLSLGSCPQGPQTTWCTVCGEGGCLPRTHAWRPSATVPSWKTSFFHFSLPFLPLLLLSFSSCAVSSLSRFPAHYIFCPPSLLNELPPDPWPVCLLPESPAPRPKFCLTLPRIRDSLFPGILVCERSIFSLGAASQLHKAP